jgi:hypothetical protein
MHFVLQRIVRNCTECFSEEAMSVVKDVRITYLSSLITFSMKRHLLIEINYNRVDSFCLNIPAMAANRRNRFSTVQVICFLVIHNLFAILPLAWNCNVLNFKTTRPIINCEINFTDSTAMCLVSLVPLDVTKSAKNKGMFCRRIANLYVGCNLALICWKLLLLLLLLLLSLSSFLLK